MNSTKAQKPKMKTGITIAVGSVLLFAFGVSTGVIGIHYIRVIENEALINPVNVTKVEGNMLTLGDGRVLELEEPMHGENWDRALDMNHNRIEVEPGKSREVVVWGSVPRTICGGTYAVRIPLIPRNVNRNRRMTIGYGYDVTGITKAEAHASD